jgi:hypothetical protein
MVQAMDSLEYPPEEITVFGKGLRKKGRLCLTNADWRHKNGRRVRI